MAFNVRTGRDEPDEAAVLPQASNYNPASGATPRTEAEALQFRDYNLAQRNGGGTYSRMNPGTPVQPQSPALTTGQPISSFNTTPRERSSLDVARDTYEQTLLESPVAPSESEIRDKASKRAQAIIDGVNTAYAPLYKGVEDAGRNREKRTRALSIGAGLGGSDFAAGAATRAEDATKIDRDMLTREKEAKIRETLLEMDDRASKEFADKRQQYLQEVQGNYEKITEFQTAQTERARNNAIALASQGINLSTLQSQAPDQYKQLIEETGYSPAVFNAFYNSQLPENQKRQYEYKTVGNKTYAISVNPATRKIETEEIDMPGGFDQFMVTPDGTPVFVNKATGQLKIASGFQEGQFIKPPAAKKGGGGGTKPTNIDRDLEDAYNAISKGADIDAVRRTFLKDYPTKAALFNSYTKKTKATTGNGRELPTN